MKGNELKIKEIEVSQTLGGSGEDRVQGRGSGEIVEILHWCQTL